MAGNCAVRAGNVPLHMRAIMIACEVVTADAGGRSGGAPVTPVAAVQGEGLYVSAEPLPGRASDHGASIGPSAEQVMNRHVTSVGSPHGAAPSWSR